MPDTTQNHIDLFSRSRLRELMMQESLENLVEFSLSMSRPCPPDCLRILSISPPDGTVDEGRMMRVGPTQVTAIPRSLPARCG